MEEAERESYISEGAEALVAAELGERDEEEYTALLEELQRKVTEKQQKLTQLESEVQQLKQGLSQVVEKKQALAETCTRLLVARSRVQLTRQLHNSNKKLLKTESEKLQLLELSNARRNERLKKVRSKNFEKKKERVKEEYEKMTMLEKQNRAELEIVRKAFLTAAHQLVFPMEVQPLSEEDAGEEDYARLSHIDCDTALETDDGWMLSGVHTHPTPNIRMVTASAPSNGNYSQYIRAARERRKAYSENAHKGVDPLSTIEKSTHPFDDPYRTVPAVLAYIAQFVQLISDVLDLPLPYPHSRPVAISDYGSADKRKREFLSSVAKLDDNIMYLCFSQNVPITALTPGHTLENLLALITHTQLGRMGAFECHPELIRYSGGSATTVHTTDYEDSEPPSVSYATTPRSHTEDCSSSSDSEDEQDHSNSDDNTTLGEVKKNPVPHGESEISEWESLDPDPADMKALEEISGRMRSSTDTTPSRERVRRLDYESTYLDYISLMGGTAEKSVQLTATDSVRLLESLDEEGESLRAKSEEAVAQQGGDEASSTGTSGVFGTLTSLWSSAFGSRTN